MASLRSEIGLITANSMQIQAIRRLWRSGAGNGAAGRVPAVRASFRRPPFGRTKEIAPGTCWTVCTCTCPTIILPT